MIKKRFDENFKFLNTINFRLTLTYYWINYPVISSSFTV